MAALKILVVDDDADLRDILRSIFEPAGFEVHEAGDGEAALQQVRAQHPDLVILDYNIPRLDGAGVCQTLKQDLLLRHLPIIMLTGRSELSDKIHGLNVGADDYVVKPYEPDELLARVRMVLRRTAQELEANPLTKLPGNVTIQKEVETRLAAHAPLSVCYCDLDRFKAFNDHYGFERGDRAIIFTAKVLLEALRRFGDGTDFLGHIGGDDFVIITAPDRAETICQGIIDDFDHRVRELYDEPDRIRGHLIHTDRQGVPVKVGFLTISVAIVNNAEQQFTHLGQIAAVGAELKAYAKQFAQSIYVKERRRNPTRNLP
jgi:PleD family two-component response regulator